MGIFVLGLVGIQQAALLIPKILRAFSLFTAWASSKFLLFDIFLKRGVKYINRERVDYCYSSVLSIGTSDFLPSGALTVTPKLSLSLISGFFSVLPLTFLNGLLHLVVQYQVTAARKPMVISPVRGVVV